MLRINNRQQPGSKSWTLPRPFYRPIKAALQKAGLGSTPRTELRQVVRQIVNSPEAFTARRDDVLASLRLALVEAAIELRLPPGLERNEFLGDLLAEVHNELQADRLRPSALPN